MLEELIIRTLCDTLPAKPLDGLFLFGQTADNQAASFETAQQLMQSKRIDKVFCLDTVPLSGYPGYAIWQRQLGLFGIGEEMLEPVTPVPADTQLLHTRIEAESMILHAKKKQYKHLVVTAAPFQQPRAFMTAVTMALQEYPELYLYSVPGKAMPWQDEVTHSQGKLEDTRAGLIAGEIERINCYHKQGDLASVDEVLDYLNRRDKGKLES
ncbi:YdcF family protein [Pontibacter sp. JH31]|uniref:YdcF family protein n=1 Tax=Pontibacter aquaedesilientis TaxID=2766980 RepID=A0ABR7XKP8_9BACT|nr:YdcF family protein [Pontibacter aquaedesilientis]MBD1398855.1 YdcF family protein [Pontibacter aquaedesilientis]